VGGRIIFTGFYNYRRSIYGPDGSTGFTLSENQELLGPDGEPTGYRLKRFDFLDAEGAYTGFSFGGRDMIRIFGPDDQLPWMK
jgi:hypothetical protein